MAILFCWIAGTIDAWWVGRKIDLRELEQTNTDS
jgi:hypothetical protein